mgnify:CR=1 FL=1
MSSIEQNPTVKENKKYKNFTAQKFIFLILWNLKSKVVIIVLANNIAENIV